MNPSQEPAQPFGQQPPQFGPPPFPPGPPQKKHTVLKVLAGAVGVVVVFGIGAAAGSGGAEDTGGKKSARPAPAVTVTVTAKAKAAKAAAGKPKAAPEPAEKAAAEPGEIIGQGSYLVGEDIAAGTYKTAGPSDSDLPLCYWARNKDSSGEMDSIIANGTPEGPSRITINKGETFETHGCAEWKKAG